MAAQVWKGWRVGQRSSGWRVQRALWCATVVVGASLLLVGCSNPFARQAAPAESGGAPARLTRLSAFPYQPLTHTINQATHAQGGGLSAQIIYLRRLGYPIDLPPSVYTITNSAQADALYAAMRALPSFPKGTFFCPMDNGSEYDLTFYRGQTLISWAVVDPSGCQQVELPNGDIRWAFGQQRFWTAFAHAVRVPLSTFYQGPMPGPPVPVVAPAQSDAPTASQPAR